MVPGGRAGLRFLSTWWPADRPRPRPEQLEEAYAWGIERFLTGGKRGSGGPDGSAISRLWQSDLDYRIRVMTGAKDRLSERQIMAGGSGTRRAGRARRSSRISTASTAAAPARPRSAG